MSKAGNGLDLSGMFAGIPKGDDLKKETDTSSNEKNNADNTNKTDNTVVEAINNSNNSNNNNNNNNDNNDNNISRKLKKIRGRGKPRMGEEPKISRTFMIDEAVWKDAQYLAKICNKSVSQYIEDLMSADIKKNEDVIQHLKNLKI